MDKEIIDKLLPAAMLGNGDGMADSFKKMSVNIDRVLRSDFVSGTSDITERGALDDPYMIKVGEDDELRADVTKDCSVDLEGLSDRFEEPYITVPRVVGA